MQWWVPIHVAGELRPGLSWRFGSGGRGRARRPTRAGSWAGRSLRRRSWRSRHCFHRGPREGRWGPRRAASPRGSGSRCRIHGRTAQPVRPVSRPRGSDSGRSPAPRPRSSERAAGRSAEGAAAAWGQAGSAARTVGIGHGAGSSGLVLVGDGQPSSRRGGPVGSSPPPTNAPAHPNSTRASQNSSSSASPVMSKVPPSAGVRP